MPKITSRRRKIQYVDIERALIRDRSLKSTSKLLYCLFVSIAESNDGNVFPSYSWLADEVGYEYKPNVEQEDPIKAEENKERAMRKFIMQHLQPLIDRGLITQTFTYSSSPDYEIIGYIDEGGGTKKFPQSEQKSSVQSEQKSSLSNKSISNKNLDTPISPKGDLDNYPDYLPQTATATPILVNPMSYDSRAALEADLESFRARVQPYRVTVINDPVLMKWGETIPEAPPMNDGIDREDPEALEKLKITNPDIYEKITSMQSHNLCQSYS